ncbi:DUF4397 domain-containing protein [Lapillicoccus sp.]|uniref:DUF4397 domain-containing protein n=1 Tax=Lapillicoccus sp. TaxID=1909287 RepID=UPI003266DDDC
MRHQRPVLTVIATTVAALAILLLGVAPAQADQSTPPGKAWVRAGHLVPGIGSTRIDLVPQSGATTSIAMSPSASYGDVTEYQKIDPGDYTVYVRPQGASLDTAPMLQRAFTVVAGKATTLAVLGTVDAPRLVALDDDLTPPAANTARVRVLPAASHAQTVSVDAMNGPTITTGAVLGQATSYATVPAGSWTLNLTYNSGLSAQQSVGLASGSVYTVVILDSGADSVQIKLITDAAGAVATPAGAAATGEGGMASEISPTSGIQTTSRDIDPLGASALALALVLLAVRHRRHLRRAPMAARVER